MQPLQPPNANRLLLTGVPGCGKTTAIRRQVERLVDLRVAGFYTAEIREHGRRVKFEVVGLSSSYRAILAHLRLQSTLRVGRYAVDRVALADLVDAELRLPAGAVDVFVIDEIGKMNRDELPEELEGWVRAALMSEGTPPSS